jgi:hypothetical protein
MFFRPHRASTGSIEMKTVLEIIDTLAGGIAGLRHHPIKVEVDGFMPLCIEWIGTGPRGFPLISIAHYYEQNGDLCRDPDCEVEVHNDVWYPCSFRNDSLGIMQEVSKQDDQGRVMIDKRPYEQLRGFLLVWDRNIRDQGFLEAAKLMAAKGGA